MHERRERGVKVKEILKDKIEKLNKINPGEVSTSRFYDYQRLMMHDCFRRVRGAIKRVR